MLLQIIHNINRDKDATKSKALGQVAILLSKKNQVKKLKVVLNELNRLINQHGKWSILKKSSLLLLENDMLNEEVSIELISSIEDVLIKSSAYFDTSMLFLKKGQEEKANYYLKFSIDHFKFHFDSTDKNNLVEKIVKTLLQENRINESENISKIITNKLCKSTCYAMISSYYHKIGDKQNYKRFINDAITISNEIDDKVYKTIAFGNIAFEFFNSGDLEKALNIIQKFCKETHYKDYAIRKIIIELFRNKETHRAIEIIEIVESNREKCYILLDLFDISPDINHEFFLRKAMNYLTKTTYGGEAISVEIVKRYFLIGKISLVKQVIEFYLESDKKIPLYEFFEIRLKENNFKEVASFLFMFLNGEFKIRNNNQKTLFNLYLDFYIHKNKMKFYHFLKITKIFKNDLDKIEFLCQNIEILIKKNDFGLSKKLIKLAEKFIDKIFDKPNRDKAIFLIQKQKIKLGNWQIIMSINLNKKIWNPDKKKIIQPYIIKILCDQGKIIFANKIYRNIKRNNLSGKNKSAFYLASYFVKNNDIDQSMKYFNEIQDAHLKVLLYIELYQYSIKNNQYNLALNYLIEAYLYVEKLTYLEWSRGKLLYLIISEITNNKQFSKIVINKNFEDPIELIKKVKDSYARDYQWFDLSLTFLERKKIEDSILFYQKISNKDYYHKKSTEYVKKMIEIYGSEKSFSFITDGKNNIGEFLYSYLEIKGLYISNDLINLLLKNNIYNVKLIEILQTFYFLKCLMFSEHIENEKLEKFNRVLNLQWAIDLKNELDQLPN